MALTRGVESWHLDDPVFEWNAENEVISFEKFNIRDFTTNSTMTIK